VTRRVLLNINDLSDKQSENSVPEDECSPHTTINDVIPKINRVITKKVPSHIASPFERSYCSRTGSRWGGKILETVNPFIRSPLDCNLSNYINNSGDFREMNFDSKRRSSGRLTNIASYRSILDMESSALVRNDIGEIPHSLPPKKRKYASYLEEDRDFSYVAKWARQKAERRLPTYVAAGYKDTRPIERRRPQLVRAGPNNSKAYRENPQYVEADSTEDYTQRTVRRGHFQAEEEEEIEYVEIELEEPYQPTPNIRHCRNPNERIIQRKIGCWCPNCFELFLTDRQFDSHKELCEHQQADDK